MNFYVGPPDAALPTSAADLGDFKPLGWITGLTATAPNTNRPFPSSAMFTFRLGRMPSAALIGIPYKHPRPVLHNGKKPRK